MHKGLTQIDCLNFIILLLTRDQPKTSAKLSIGTAVSNKIERKKDKGKTQKESFLKKRKKIESGQGTRHDRKLKAKLDI